MSYSECLSCHKLFDFSRKKKHRCGVGRKRKARTIVSGNKIQSHVFKPQGVPLTKTKTVTLTADELEALKLKNIKDLHQTEIAERMSISQSTLARTLKEAHKKITLALVNGWSIQIK